MFPELYPGYHTFLLRLNLVTKDGGPVTVKRAIARVVPQCSDIRRNIFDRPAGPGVIRGLRMLQEIQGPSRFASRTQQDMPWALSAPASFAMPAGSSQGFATGGKIGSMGIMPD